MSRGLLKRLLRASDMGRERVCPVSNDDVEHYLGVREALGDIYSDVIDDLPLRAVRDVARELDIPEEDALSQLDGANRPLIDCCVHEWAPDGRTVIRRYAEDGPRPRDPDRREALDALLRARFMLLRVEESLPRSGVTVTDLLTGEELFVFDVSLSMGPSARGMVIAGHVLPMGDHWMQTGGAAMLSEEEGRRLVADFERGGEPLTPESVRQRETVYAVFRWCEREAGDVLLLSRDVPSVFDLAEEVVQELMAPPGLQLLPLPVAPRGPSRNASCPCGSGRQHKRCCGRKKSGRRSA